MSTARSMTRAAQSAPSAQTQPALRLFAQQLEPSPFTTLSFHQQSQPPADTQRAGSPRKRRTS
ncbi:MAG TPA: hypothetical protein PLN52_22515 [Opitutaceae bacterium]|nr:hypothetical protein [Opitutaceae bacterium]